MLFVCTYVTKRVCAEQNVTLTFICGLAQYLNYVYTNTVLYASVFMHQSSFVWVAYDCTVSGCSSKFGFFFVV